MSKEMMFPIMGDPIIKAIPWPALLPHEASAQRNHGGQTLNRLAQRGGLGIEEAYHILRDEPCPTGDRYNKDLVRVALMRMLAKFNAGQN
ncbi:hypothetical protein [Pararhodobacter zhoushanensis]|uniref:Uncharacterized protein n=1 Tax=Pararhodobacter zhoushanensis TaxID=2479545 RepID=A0ABT3GYF7_9RHOB|nr:hypothetical protein [Pararhodobacter zhoushanensis]MCW1932594.1 hypothetical protein [Pararhodobacter zhoushanensis]